MCTVLDDVLCAGGCESGMLERPRTGSSAEQGVRLDHPEGRAVEGLASAIDARRKATKDRGPEGDGERTAGDQRHGASDGAVSTQPLSKGVSAGLIESERDGEEDDGRQGPKC